MKKLSVAVILFFGLAFNQAEAQFEGKIQFQGYEMESGEKVKDDDPLTLYVTPDRILLQGDQKYTVRGSLKAEGIMVRQKEQDFVLLTGKKTAMSITKSGITAFMNMFGNDAKNDVQKAEKNFNVTNSGESKTINGYTAQKFVITDKEKPRNRTEVWMTKDLDINWGMLASSWDTNMEGFADSELPLDLILEDGYFPVQWEHYKNDKLNHVVETDIDETDVARSIVQIESGVKIVSLQDYLFQQMRKNN